jgi:GH24 family phage-related lysozyme (muramidase)
MGQIDALTKSGLTVTKDTENALREYNKAVQDQKQAQSSGFEGWANKVGDMKSKLQDLESSFADGLSTAITGALSGKKGNFSALAQNIGGQMIKLGVDQVLKQGIQASGIGNLFGLGSGEAAAKAKAASDALAAAGAKQVAGAGANADAMAKQLTTASMAVTATTVNINGAVAGAAPGMPGGNQAGLPGTGGASLPSGAGTSTPQQVDIASVGGTALTTPTIPFSAPGQIAAGTAAMGTVGAGAGFGIGTLGNPGEGGLGRGSINWGTSGGQGPAMKGLGEAGIPYLGGNISSKKAFELNPPPANLNLPATPAVAQKAFEQQGLGNPFKSGVAGMGQNPGMGGFGVEAFGKLPSSGGASNAAQLIARKEAFLGTARMDVNAQRLGYGSDTITDQTGSIRRVKAGDTVSKDDAMLDLQRRSAISEATAKKQIGADTFNKFDPNTRAALTSNAYNYGSLKPGLTSAAQTGDKEKIAAALEAQSAQAARGGPGQKGNIARRQEEADIVRGNKDLNGRPIDKNAQRGGFDGHPTPPANIPQVDNVHIDQAKKQAEVGNKAMLDVQKQGHNQQIDAAHKAQTDSLQAQTRAGMQSTQAVRQSAQQQVQTVQASGQQTTAAFQQAGTGIQTAGTDAQTAGPEFQQAGQQIQQAGQQAQSGGGDMGGFGQSIAGLAGPLSQGKQGMGSFAQAALGMVSKMLSGMGGGGGGGGIGGMLGGLFGGMHSGGLVGSSSMYSTSHFVSPAVFANAQRFHSGLMNDEYPAILQRGERVLTANDNSRNTALLAGMSDHMQQMQRGSAASQGGNGGPRSQSMHMTINTPDASSFRKSQPQIMSEAHSKMQRAGSKSA